MRYSFMDVTEISGESIWKALEDIPDPEIPVISIVDLGIVREVKASPNGVEVLITPTYTGCPAMKVIENEIITKLREIGIKQYTVKTVIAPPWTTDWISETGRAKLKAYGIAPPAGSIDKNTLLPIEKDIHCPLCGSLNTEMRSQFGSTACKALYFCNQCKEPFDYFKCI